MRKTKTSQEGQAVVEYVLMLLMGVFLVTILTGGFKRVLYTSWTRIAKEVSAGCPTCQADEIRPLRR